MNIIDRAVILDNDIKALTKEFSTVKDEIKAMGLGTHEGEVGVVTVRKNADSEVFDAKAAFAYMVEQGHISSQLETALLKKFTTVKDGPVVLTTRAKVIKVLA